MKFAINRILNPISHKLGGFFFNQFGSDGSDAY